MVRKGSYIMKSASGLIQNNSYSVLPTEAKIFPL